MYRDEHDKIIEAYLDYNIYQKLVKRYRNIKEYFWI